MKREHILVGIIFLVVLGTRLFFAYQTPYFSSDDAYYNIRQMVHIKETFLPMFNDELSYGGKTLYLPPLFFYVLAFLSLIFKTEFVGKVFPAVFSSTIVIAGYLIADELTQNRIAKLFTALIAGFMPIFFSETVNSISIYSFFIPIAFFNIYFMMKIIDNHREFLAYFIVSLLMLRMTTPMAIFLIFAFLLYLLFLHLEQIKTSRIERELILFSTFLIVWTLFIFFKKSFLEYGFAILWQNTPLELLKNYFINTNLITIIYYIGIIPFVCGLFAIYLYVFKERDKKTYLLASFAVVIALLMWFRLIELNAALILLGFVMTFLFAKTYDNILTLVKNQKIKHFFTLIFLLLIVISSILPCLVLASNKIGNSFSKKEIEALLWLRSNTNPNDVILSTLEEGHLISAISIRKNFIDSNFMFVEDIDQRLIDAGIIYTTTSETQRIGLMNKYPIDYIYFSRRAKNDYKIDRIPFLDEECFHKVFANEDAVVYHAMCKIKEK
jgi:hypothetical protein